MKRLPTYGTSLWIATLILLLISVTFWIWQEKIAQRHTLLSQKRDQLTLCQQEKLRKNTLCAQKQNTLTHMRSKNFTQNAPTTSFLQKELLKMAKTHHLEKIRFEVAPSQCTQNLCKTPITLYLQSALDTDIFDFMKDVRENGPWTMTWENIGLYRTPQNGVQADGKGIFYVHAP